MRKEYNIKAYYRYSAWVGNVIFMAGSHAEAISRIAAWVPFPLDYYKLVIEEVESD